MATFKITGPDGASYKITAPQGASQQEIMTFVRSQVESQQTAPQPPSTAVQEPPTASSDFEARNGSAPVPGLAPTPVESRAGDVLKPVFGGHNPIAETYDTILQPFGDVASDRSTGERIGDTAAFVASMPNQMLRLPTPGQGLESVTGYGWLRESEERFNENNPALLRSLGAIGEVVPGITRGIGQGAGHAPPVRRPTPAPTVPPPTRGQGAPLPSSGSARARQYVQDLDELGISRHGPAIAQAARDGEGLGIVAKTVEGMPVVSAPLRRSTNEFIQSAARSADDIAQQYSQGGGNIERAGAVVRDHMDRFRNERVVARDAIERMPDSQLHQLATRPPRAVGSLKTAQDARYEAAWRNIPERMRRGGSRENELRLMGGLPASRGVLNELRARNQRMTLQSGDDAAGASSAPIASGGLLGDMVRAIENRRWRATLQTMRDMRSSIRRLGSRTADTEANSLSRADMARLESAITSDMQSLMTRIANDARVDGHHAMADGFERAISGFRSADQFTRRYAEAFDEIKRLTNTTRDAQAIGTIISAAKTGSRGDSRLLMQLRRMAPDEVMDDVASAVINEIGRPTGRASGAIQDAQWSPGKFAAQWNDLNTTGRRAIFGHRPELFSRLERFARVSQGMADYEALANTSRSGTHSIVGMGILAGPSAIIGNVNGVIMSGLTAYGAARWMTSPAYVSWLTRSMEIQRQVSSSRLQGQGAARAVRRHVSQLRNLLSRDRSLDPMMVRAILTGLNNNDRR